MQTQIDPKKIEWPQLLKSKDFSVELIWSLYAICLKGVDKESVQYKETKRAFMCGFAECFKIMSEYAGELSEDDACALFTKIATETNTLVQEYINEIPHR